MVPQLDVELQWLVVMWIDDVETKVGSFENGRLPRMASSWKWPSEFEFLMS